jgi:flavin reductase (DIM6/NTAB) family NADH-FMN oxidoreductase RutF
VVGLSKANHTCRVARQAPRLAVHLLGEGDHDLAELFGGETGDDVDKFTRCAWTPGPDGLPLLDRCPNRVVGTRVTVLDDGSDHLLVVLAPESAARGGPFRPLRLSAVDDVTPGHEAEERPRPASERALR